MWKSEDKPCKTLWTTFSGVFENLKNRGILHLSTALIHTVDNLPVDLCISRFARQIARFRADFRFVERFLFRAFLKKSDLRTKCRAR